MAWDFPEDGHCRTCGDTPGLLLQAASSTRCSNQDSAVNPMRLISGPQRSNSVCWLRAMASGVPP